MKTSYGSGFRWNLAALGAVALAYSALAQEQQPGLTPAGKAILKDVLVGDRRALMDPTKPAVFPLPMCTFPGGLCGAVHRDGTVAVPPRYDWVGTFVDGRAAVRRGGLYGFIDEDGREIVKPQYAIVDNFKFGFAQVDVDGKSGLIDHNFVWPSSQNTGLSRRSAGTAFVCLMSGGSAGCKAGITSRVAGGCSPRPEASPTNCLSRAPPWGSSTSPDSGSNLDLVTGHLRAADRHHDCRAAGRQHQS